MMRTRGHWLRWGVISLLVMMLAVVGVTMKPAKADSSTVPTGLTFPTNFFSTTTGIVDSSTGQLFQLYNIGGNVGNFQSIWSKQPSFTLKRSMSLGFWVRLPDVADSGNDDGMAFVLAKSNTKPLADSNDSGETLGVYADPKKVWSDKSASTAIPNSWALEFDLHKNDDEGWTHYEADGNYDYNSGVAVPHAAWTYPGEYNSSYTRKSVGVFGQLVQLKHNNTVSIAKKTWFHVSVKYDKATDQLLYAVNDADKNGTVPALTASNATAKIDASDLRAKLNVSDSSTIYFGFTSANHKTGGTQNADTNANQYVFDYDSELYQSQAKMSVNGTNKYNSDDKSTDAVKASVGDDLQYDMTLKNLNRDTLKSGSLTADLPTHLEWSPKNGAYGTVTYTSADGKTSKTQQITSSDVTDTSNKQSLNLKISDDLQTVGTADSVGYVRGTLTVHLNTTVITSEDTSIDALNLELNDTDYGLTGPKITASAGKASIKSQTETGGVYTEDGSDQSAKQYTVKNGSEVSHDYILSNLGVNALTNSSVKISIPDGATIVPSASANVSEAVHIKYVPNGSDIEKAIPYAEQAIETKDFKSGATIALDGLSQEIAEKLKTEDVKSGTLVVEIVQKIDGKTEATIEPETVELMRNYGQDQSQSTNLATFQSPKWKIAPAIAASLSVKMQDINYSVPAPNDTYKAAQQDILRYTYTLTYDVSNSSDTSWKGLVLTTNLQNNLKIRAINGKAVDSNSGYAAIYLQSIWGDLNAADADSDGKITKTITIDYELASVDGVTSLPDTQAKVDGEGSSGPHSEEATNPGFQIATAKQEILDFSTMQVYNEGKQKYDSPKSISSEANEYDLERNDTDVVLAGGLWQTNDQDTYDVFTVINGVKTQTDAKAGSWGLIFTRNGVTGANIPSSVGNLVYKASPLNAGTNNVQIYALNETTKRYAQVGSTMAPKDSTGHALDGYPYVEYTIVDPTPTLVIDNSIKFKDTELTGDSEYISTSDSDAFSMAVKYADADNWALSAQTTTFKDANDAALKGELVYRTSKGTYLLNDSPDTIYSNDGAAGLEQSTGSEFDISKKWTHENYPEDKFAGSSTYGMYLNVFSNATATDTGSTSYTGQVTWTFSNTPLSSTVASQN